MFWVIIALLNPAFHAGANILDDILARRKMKNTWALMFYASLFNLAFLPIVVLMDKIQMPDAGGWLLIVLLGLTNFLYLYPYYKALQHIDTSIVSALFSLTKIFIPIGAYFLVGEVLTPTQYAGCLLIILASGLLTFDFSKVKFNPAFFYMLFSSAAIVVEGLLFKEVFERGMTWGTAFGGQMVVAFLWMLLPCVIFSVRKGISSEWGNFKKIIPLFSLEELLTYGGSMGGVYAISQAPLTLVKTIESFQPIFVVAYIAILTKFFPKRFEKEKTPIMKQVILFALMFAGAFILAQG